VICYRRRPGRSLKAFREGTLYRYLRDDDAKPGCIWLQADDMPRRVSLRYFERMDGEPGATVLGPSDARPFMRGRADGGPPDVPGITARRRGKT
jgi:hypothetical protein